MSDAGRNQVFDMTAFGEALTPHPPEPRLELVVAFTSLALALGCPLHRLDEVWLAIQREPIAHTPNEIQAQVREVMRGCGIAC